MSDNLTLGWKIGVEIELMAPRGASRADLAARVARRSGGTVRRFFHPQSEPSLVPGRPTFENLTPGFEVIDGEGRRIAAFVDDLTLQEGLDREAPPREGWYRIVSDDGRLLRLVMRHGLPDRPLDQALVPFAALFGVEPEAHPGGMVRIVDDRGLPVAIGAPLPGERDRPCEIVTAPISADHHRVLASLLDDAKAAGFYAPVEGATHLHFDAQPLLSAPVMAVVAEMFWRHGDALKRMLRANPRCVRLGRWTEAVPNLTRSAAFRAMPWPEARQALAGLGLTKYCDFNLLNIASDMRAKHTLEIRILPVSLDAAEIIGWARLFEALLRWAARVPDTVPHTLGELLGAVDLPGPERVVWRQRQTAF